MSVPHQIKPAHKSIKAYYAALQAYDLQDVSHETALRSAFQTLLADTARRFAWTLIPELSAQSTPGGTANGTPLTVAPKHPTRIIPDATFRDEFFIERGHWEAKDTHDDLDAEIKKKIARGYPLTNIIFEDTRTARLFQDGKPAGSFDLTKPQPLADLLSAFFTHTEPAHDKFDSVDRFWFANSLNYSQTNVCWLSCAKEMRLSSCRSRILTEIS